LTSTGGSNADAAPGGAGGNGGETGGTRAVASGGVTAGGAGGAPTGGSGGVGGIGGAPGGAGGAGGFGSGLHEGAFLVVLPSTFPGFGDLYPFEATTRSVMVANQGTVPSGELQVTAGDGVTVTGCAGALQPGAGCQLSITATATALGTFSSTVTITADPGTAQPIEITVMAWVMSFKVSPSEIELSSVPVNASFTRTITITAAVDLTDISAAVSSEDYPLQLDLTNKCASTLAAGESCTIDVSIYVSSPPGQRSGGVIVRAGNGQSEGVPISATVYGI
jgi:hypothetical protein